MIRILYAAEPERVDEFRAHFAPAMRAADLPFDLAEDHAPETVDYIVYAPSNPLRDFRPFTRAKAVLSMWAGVESIVGNDTITQPLCRMVEPGLREGMVEWVTGHVLRHHLLLDRFLAASREGRWDYVEPPLARNRPVGILGLGELGTASAQALAALRFPVTGWSRRQKEIAGVTCLAGDDGLRETLTQAQILVLLLPLTPETENVLDAEALARLPQGAVILNPGRGPLIDDTALLAALDTGQVGHATLDVFREEPLPGDHPFWSHPGVTVTPHVASATRTETAVETLAENIRRGEAGEPLLHVVDRGRGY